MNHESIISTNITSSLLLRKLFPIMLAITMLGVCARNCKALRSQNLLLEHTKHENALLQIMIEIITMLLGPRIA